jgi:hypothetical protein
MLLPSSWNRLKRKRLAVIEDDCHEVQETCKASDVDVTHLKGIVARHLEERPPALRDGGVVAHPRPGRRRVWQRATAELGGDGRSITGAGRDLRGSEGLSDEGQGGGDRREGRRRSKGAGAPDRRRAHRQAAAGRR